MAPWSSPFWGPGTWEVQVKFLPAIFYWAWLGVFANNLSVGSAIVCPKNNKNPHIKIGLLPRGQNPLSYYTL
jgi:hypothetical protein